MKQEFKNYLLSIGQSDVSIDRIDEILNEVKDIFNKEPQDILISQSNQGETLRESSLWILTENEAMECKNFLTSKDYDWLRIKNNIAYTNIVITPSAVERGDKKSLRILVAFSSSLQMNIYVEESFFDHAMDVYKKYIVPNAI